jgi:TatA/E family protein of Tat protein translocase
MMKRMSFSETIFLFFLALIIFGPKKLPEIARQVGKYLNEFKRASNEFRSQIEQEIAHLEEKPTILPPSPTPEGTTSRNLRSGPYESHASDALATLGTDEATVEVRALESQAVGTGAVEDEPLFATKESTAAVAPAAVAAEIPASGVVPSPSSQESHV